MAITSRVYLAFFYSLASAEHLLYYDIHKVCLLKDTYTPNFAAHSTFSDVSSFEIAADANYSAGGMELQNQNTAVTATSWSLLTDPLVTYNLQGQFRYAVVYRQGTAPNNSQLMLCIDFGETLSYTGADDFTLDFTDGVIVLQVPA